MKAKKRIMAPWTLERKGDRKKIICGLNIAVKFSLQSPGNYQNIFRRCPRLIQFPRVHSFLLSSLTEPFFTYERRVHMKKIVLAVAIVLMMAVSASARDIKGKSINKTLYTIEKDAQIFGAVKGRMDIVDTLVKFVQAHGNTCDSVSAASDNVFSKGFILKCNGYNYTYQILDKGGKWYLKVDQ